MKAYAVAIALLLVIFGSIGGYLYKRFSAFASMDFSPPPVTIAASVANLETWNETLNAVGTIQAVRGVELTSEGQRRDHRDPVRVRRSREGRAAARRAEQQGGTGEPSQPGRRARARGAAVRARSSAHRTPDRFRRRSSTARAPISNALARNSPRRKRGSPTSVSRRHLPARSASSTSMSATTSRPAP